MCESSIFLSGATPDNMPDLEPQEEMNVSCPSLDSVANRSIGDHPLPLSLRHTYKNVFLPCSEIPKQSLNTEDDVLKSILDGKKEKAGTIAQKQAKECIFGEGRCTPAGSKELPALPTAELYKLKTIIFQQLPHYWRNPQDFEVVWKEKCWVAIDQACRRLWTQK